MKAKRAPAASTGRPGRSQAKPKHVRHARSKGGRRQKQAAESKPRTVRVRPLDPRVKCGEGTSVRHLFRVDETVNGASISHLVFYDRHGWYCEHGKGCPAVDDVRRANKNLDWTG